MPKECVYRMASGNIVGTRFVVCRIILLGNFFNTKNGNLFNSIGWCERRVVQKDVGALQRIDILFFNDLVLRYQLLRLKPLWPIRSP